MTPQRIQLRRTKGWRKPEGAIVVARPSKWGNPFVVHQHTDHRCGPNLDDCPAWRSPSTAGIAVDRADAVRLYRHTLLFPVIGDPPLPTIDDIRTELAGRDLACWCPPGPCHADVLLDIANQHHGRPHA